MAPVAQDFVADFTRARIVDQDAADRRLPGDASAVDVELDDVAVLGEDDVGLRIAPFEDARRNAAVL
jgi:hypothetical protein